VIATTPCRGLSLSRFVRFKCAVGIDVAKFHGLLLSGFWGFAAICCKAATKLRQHCDRSPIPLSFDLKLG